MTKQSKPPRLDQVLGTKNKAEQASRALALQGPVVDLVIRYDSRYGLPNGIRVSQIGGDLPIDLAREILRIVDNQLIQSAIQAEAQAAAGGNGAAPAPPPPAPPPPEDVEPEPEDTK